jgi:hypothetical protein
VPGDSLIDYAPGVNCFGTRKSVAHSLQRYRDEWDTKGERSTPPQSSPPPPCETVKPIIAGS